VSLKIKKQDNSYEKKSNIRKGQAKPENCNQSTKDRQTNTASKLYQLQRILKKR
jgi:hypothetical protein